MDADGVRPVCLVNLGGDLWSAELTDMVMIPGDERRESVERASSELSFVVTLLRERLFKIICNNII